MDSFGARYSVWALTLQITQNKSGLRVLYQIGVRSKFCLNDLTPHLRLLRCDAAPDNLDSGTGHRRTHEKTDYLIKNFGPKDLWDAFGIYEDVIVRYEMQMPLPVADTISAIFSQFSSRRHTRTALAGPSSPSHQGSVQRPSCYMGR